MSTGRLSSLLVALSFIAAVPADAAKPLKVLHGSEEGAVFGTSVSAAGDVDRDGFDDYIVGEPQSRALGEDTGRAVVYSGRRNRPLYELLPEREGTRFGYAVAGVGDVDRDGHADVAVGAPLDEAGKVFVYSGADGSLILRLTPGLPDAPTTNPRLFGAFLDGAGDVDRDGFDDLVVSVPGEGSVRIVSGADGSVLRRFDGFTGVAWSLVGIINVAIRLPVRYAGDVDADGVPDMMVGDNWAKGGRGTVSVFSGRDGSLLHEWKGHNRGSSYFGLSLDSAGDIDRDGHDDVLIGISGTLNQPFVGGEVDVRSGRTGKLLREHLGPEGQHFFLGRAVRGIGDITGDGVPDYALGAPYTRHLLGQLWIISGATGERIRKMNGKRKKRKAEPKFSYVISAAGDVDRDGVPDLLVASPGQNEFTGAVRVYSGLSLRK